METYIFVFFVVIVILVLLGIFYYITNNININTNNTNNNTNNNNNNNTNIKTDNNQDNFISILSNVNNDNKIESRIVLPIVHNSNVYIVCNKNINYVEDNKNVTLITYISRENLVEQIIFTGELNEVFNGIDHNGEFKVLKMLISEKKVYITTKIGLKLITNSYINNEKNESDIFDLNNIKNVKDMLINGIFS